MNFALTTNVQLYIRIELNFEKKNPFPFQWTSRDKNKRKFFGYYHLRLFMYYTYIV